MAAEVRYIHDAVGPVQLMLLDRSDLIERAAGWLAQKENCQWLDFGDGSKVLTPAWLKILTRSENHIIRTFTAADMEPIGIVALTNLNRAFRTATVWAALGDKRYARHGYTTQAVSQMLGLGFRELGLHSINTWTVEHNPSVQIARRLQFRFIGRQRQCHWIDGRPYDRLLFDLLASEYLESNRE